MCKSRYARKLAQKAAYAGYKKFAKREFQVHCEMPNAKDGPIRGLQLWVNLAKEFKMVEPEYQEHSPDEIVTKSQNGVKVKGMEFIFNRLIQAISFLRFPLFSDCRRVDGRL